MFAKDNQKDSIFIAQEERLLNNEYTMDESDNGTTDSPPASNDQRKMRE